MVGLVVKMGNLFPTHKKRVTENVKISVKFFVNLFPTNSRSGLPDLKLLYCFSLKTQNKVKLFFPPAFLYSQFF